MKDNSSESQGGTSQCCSNDYTLPICIVLAAVILAGTLLYVGADLGGKIASVSDTLKGISGGAVNPSASPSSPGSGTGTGTQPQVNFKALADEGPVIGDPKAPVTVLLFSDFSCPFCAAAAGFGSKDVVDYLKNNDPAWVPAVPGIIENYVKTGKARLAFKYFPGHGAGVAAFKVGLCANDQNTAFFWKFHDLAFADQADTGDTAKMVALAKQAGADETKLNECLSSKKFDSRVSSDTAAGRALGVGGTPYFFINSADKVLKGAYGYADVKAVLDAELKAAS
ncbi:Thioredoxin [uncultured archaeon]|nr:Thioredoxin [uncultured archaeon]